MSSSPVRHRISDVDDTRNGATLDDHRSAVTGCPSADLAGRQPPVLVDCREEMTDAGG
jgi:hypothetical protein